MNKVYFSFVGLRLDAGFSKKRWGRWRPSVAIGQLEALAADRIELIYQAQDAELARRVKLDLESLNDTVVVNVHEFAWDDAWGLEEVYTSLYDFASSYTFDISNEEYFFNITTGTHIFQICMYLLTESRHLPGKLLQLSMGKSKSPEGDFQIIDLDLARYTKLAERFNEETMEQQDFLKSGIQTQNKAFNQMIAEIEFVSVNTTAPMLITGPTGAGKSQLTKRIYELKKSLQHIQGDYVAVNCATLRGQMAMSTLFGHLKGAFTGAVNDREGMLLAADSGILFLDEVGELGLDEQAMLLKAIEEKCFYPVGSEDLVYSNFQIICGTNQNLFNAVQGGEFREDLLARINIWDFELPSLKERIEDLEANIDYELKQFSVSENRQIRFNKEAYTSYLSFAKSSQAKWSGNFRDLNASIIRMGTLSPKGRIREEVVEAEIKRLSKNWQVGKPVGEDCDLGEWFSQDELAEIDLFDQLQLQMILPICQQSRSLSEAGRVLYQASRERKKQSNDADRLKKYLAKFNLTWQMVQSV